MPSLRQPVGPLPASIYWRRRLVVFAALIAVLALIVWLTSGSDGGSKPPHGAQPAPAQSITPGASPTGSAITTAPAVPAVRAPAVRAASPAAVAATSA